MQRSKFCSVGAISKIFERDFSMFYCISLSSSVQASQILLLML
ncbi:hypothetical protein [Campylobacter concisus]|nr:hypothetical protein [Campylobacter concisus]